MNEKDLQCLLFANYNPELIDGAQQVSVIATYL